MTANKTADEVLNYNGSFNQVDEKLDVLRASSMAYLKNALKDL